MSEGLYGYCDCGRSRYRRGSKCWACEREQQEREQPSGPERQAPIDPFDTPTGVAFTSTRRQDLVARAAASVQERLAEAERQRAKTLELQVAALKAELENVTRDRDRLSDSDPQNVQDALAGREEAERQRAAEAERSRTLGRELAHLRGLHEHTVASLTAANAELARVAAVLGEIGSIVNVEAQGDGSQIRRAVSLLKLRSAVLDEVLDGMLESMSPQVRELLCDEEIGILDPRHPLALHLHVAGALTFKDGWHWTAIGEALRQRRLERLGGRRRSGEYEATS